MQKYKNPGTLKFDTRILDADGRGAYIEFPFDVSEKYGAKGRVPVKAWFDDVPYRGSLCKMGTPCHILIVVKSIREQLHKGPGDDIHVKIELDEEERVIELPIDALDAIKVNERAKGAWNALSFTHQREYALWIEGAKKPETRARRIQDMIEKLLPEKRLR